MAKKARGKSPITFSEPYRNDNADIGFGAAVKSVVQAVRNDIGMMAISSDVNEYAPGAIHALRKLCEGEDKLRGIYKAEVTLWQEIVSSWLDRVEKSIPAAIRKEYRANLEDDLRVILSAAGGMLLDPRQTEVRYISVEFASEAALEQARKAAATKHPIKLGSALHNYLEDCVRKLVSES